MDGMNWFRGNEVDALAQQELDRKALRNAMLMTVATVVLAVGFILALDALGVRPGGGEYASPAVEIIG